MTKFYSEEEFMEERRQKNLIQKKYQALKHYEDEIKFLKEELQQAKANAEFDKARADRIISRVETVLKELAYQKIVEEIDYGQIISLVNWILIGGKGCMQTRN